MSLVDWLIVIGFLIFTTAVAASTRKYTQSVTDFMSANRCAGRYLLGVARGIAGLGAITMVAQLEMYYEAGFTVAWWSMMAMPVWLIMSLSGWITYRFRQTRALTLAQFFETRYSRKFRIFAGLLAFAAGIINYGIFPSVIARFIMYYCGFPTTPAFWGIPLSYAVIMFLVLAISVLYTCWGGQIAVMVTDFIPDIFCKVILLLLIPRLFERNLINAVFAFPSTGGAFTLIFKASWRVPSILSTAARGVSRTLKRTDPPASSIMGSVCRETGSPGIKPSA